jgi:hypothetical protein
MSERRSILHYAYQPVATPPESLLRAARANERVPQVYYVPPTEEELAMMHNGSYIENGDEFAELTELLTPQPAENSYARADTPIMDESDGDETEWSLTETENVASEESPVEIQINEISSSKGDIEDEGEKISPSRKRKRSLKSSAESSEALKDEKELEDELDTTIATKKRKTPPAKVVRTRYIHTRQADRKTRSNRIFGVQNEEPKRSKSFKIRVPVERNNKTNKENAVDTNKEKSSQQNPPTQPKKVNQKKFSPILKAHLEEALNSRKKSLMDSVLKNAQAEQRINSRRNFKKVKEQPKRKGRSGAKAK